MNERWINDQLPTQRVLSIDIMRGLTLFLMLFVNDLYVPGVPSWLVHTEASVDGMGLADWVFPGFLFMVGMSVPYAIRSRRKKGRSNSAIFGHIVLRTLSLLLIGVLIMNIGRLNPTLTGIDRNLWAILLYVSIFLVWNNYPADSRHDKLYLTCRVAGIIGFVVLACIFRAGSLTEPAWLEIGWWGILGLIGWGYFAAATTFLLCGSKLLANIAVWLFFVLLNIGNQLELLNWLDFLKPVFGVLLSGNVPTIVLAGLVVGLLLSMPERRHKKVILIIMSLGIGCLLLGFFLRNWFIVSKIYGTPSWAMICNGVSMLIYVLLYFIVDVLGRYRWANMFGAAGKNSLTTYLAPDVIYFVCWGWGIPLFFYKQETSQFLAVAGSLVWAMTMIGFAIVLTKIHIRLKL